MKIDLLREKCEEIIKNGEKIGCITATMGTTDSLGMDNLKAIAQMRDELVDKYQLDYKPHIHADAVIGWVWSVFNDYDFDKNPLDIEKSTLKKLKNLKSQISTLKYADSIGIDFHKTGYAPYVSSMILVKDPKDLTKIGRDSKKMPYLYQFGNYKPGIYTLESSRSGAGAIGALANLKTLGKNGYRTLLAHSMKSTQDLRDLIKQDPSIVTVNEVNNGPVTLFRVYPEGMNSEKSYEKEIFDPAAKENLKKIDEYNRRIFKYMYKKMLEGKASAISITDRYRDTDYGEPILALKQYVMSPFTEETHAKELMDEIKEAQKYVRYDDIIIQ